MSVKVGSEVDEMSYRGVPRGPLPPERAPRSYKVLCVSSLHPKASDDVVRDTLYREYKKYGDIRYVCRILCFPKLQFKYVQSNFTTT